VGDGSRLADLGFVVDGLSGFVRMVPARVVLVFIRRGVRVVEGARLESVYTRKGIAGSNPALSADEFLAPH
jgi:hypothetical protein